MSKKSTWTIRWDEPVPPGFSSDPQVTPNHLVAKSWARELSKANPAYAVSVWRDDEKKATFRKGKNMALIIARRFGKLRRSRQETTGATTVDPNAFWALDEFRCVRPACYPIGTPIEGMQGHYFRAANEDEARAKMVERYPGETFEVRLWKKGEKV